MSKKASTNAFYLTIYPRVGEDPFDVEIDAELAPDFPEEEIQYFQDVMRGLIAHLNVGLEMTHFIGCNMRMLGDLDDELGSVILEPSPELSEAIKKEAAEKIKSNILQFKKKLH